MGRPGAGKRRRGEWQFLLFPRHSSPVARHLQYDRFDSQIFNTGREHGIKKCIIAIALFAALSSAWAEGQDPANDGDQDHRFQRHMLDTASIAGFSRVGSLAPFSFQATRPDRG